MMEVKMEEYYLNIIYLIKIKLLNNKIIFDINLNYIIPVVVDSQFNFFNHDMINIYLIIYNR